VPKRAETKLTQTKVNQLRPPKIGHVEHADGWVPGMRLRIKSSCVKSYYLYFRDPKRNKKPTSALIGHHPELSLAEARAKAIAARESQDPRTFLSGAVQKDERLRFADLAENYIARGMKQSRGPQANQPLRSAKRVESRIRRHLVPAFNDFFAEEITKKDATTLFDKVIDKSGPGEVRKCHALLLRMLRWAVDRGDIAANPLEGLKCPTTDSRRDRILSDAELARVWNATHELGIYGVAVRLLILSGCRRSEIGNLSWHEIEGDRIIIPASRSKNGEQHSFVMPKMMRDEIDTLPRYEGPFVFTTTKGKRPMGQWARPKATLDALAGVEGWTIHDVRRTMRSGLSRLGVPLEVAERVLGHKPTNQIVATYDRHHYQDEVAAALEKWSSHIRDLVQPPPDNVTKLRRA